MPSRHILKLIFRSRETFLLLYLPTDEQRHFRQALETLTLDATPYRFWPIYTLDGKAVLVNLAQVRICHFLDAMPDEIPNPPPDDDDAASTLLIGLEGTDEPFESAADSPEESYDFFCNAEEANGREQIFVSYHDDDGEEVFVNLRHVTYLQAPAALVEQGRQLAMKEEA